jgi:putative lipoprotein
MGVSRWFHGLPASLILVGVCAGCTMPHPPPDHGSPSTSVMWQCGELRLEARSHGDGVALHMPDRTLTLSIAESASGARYVDGAGNEFWSKAQEARLTLAGGRATRCVVTTARPPWVEARERGVVYRALGQESAWIVEMGPGKNPPLLVTLDYGSRVLRVVSSGVAPGRNVYRGRAGETVVKLIVTPGPCRDTMSGEDYETRAELRVGEAIYTGCGRFL